MELQAILLIVGAYLLGSVPTSYLAGRIIRGIDIQDYGSGVASASNVWHSVSRWAVAPVGIIDILKGFTPVYIAAYILDFTVVWQGAVALAAMAGHSWSIFLGFRGGRGFATMMGGLVILAPWILLVFVVIWLLGLALFKNSSLWMLLGAGAMPIASVGLGEPPALSWFLFGMFLLLIIKRLLAERTVPSGEWKRVLTYRLLFDRDTRHREAWIYRTPSDIEGSPPKK